MMRQLANESTSDWLRRLIADGANEAQLIAATKIFDEEKENRLRELLVSDRRLIVKWGQSSFELEVEDNITLDSLIDSILDYWDSLIRVDFILLGDKRTINSDSKLSEFLKSMDPSNEKARIITVQSQAEGFSTMNRKAILNWAKVTEIVIDDSRFDGVAIDENDETIKAILDHAVLDLQYKNDLYGPITDCVEASVREFISAVLLACAKISGDIKLAAEKQLTGKRGQGQLDYAMIYKKYYILVTEAKRDRLNDGVLQNIAQLVASREEFLFDLSGSNKRKYMDTAPEFAEVPSTGVTSTGKEWILIRYVLSPQPAVYRSSPLPLPLLGGSSTNIRSSLIEILSKLLGAIKLHKRLLDENQTFKSRKLT